MNTYHYTESGLPNVYLKNGFEVETINGAEYTSISDLDRLHKALGEILMERNIPMTAEAFKFLRLEMNVSQRILAIRFGVTEQTVARYEKGQTAIPRVTDAVFRTLYLESVGQVKPVSYFLDMLADEGARKPHRNITLKDIDNKWVLV